MKAFIAAMICAAAIGVGGVLCAPYATGDGRRRIFNKRRARRRPRTQSSRDELNQVSFMARYGSDARSHPFRLLPKTFAAELVFRQ